MSETSETSLTDLQRKAVELRELLEPHFSPETALGGGVGSTPSAGQCAATAVVVNSVLGGVFVSARVNGESHWFNRIETASGSMDVDLTGDQFGGRRVQIAPAGMLYSSTFTRENVEVTSETRARARLLATRAGLLRDEVLAP